MLVLNVYIMYINIQSRVSFDGLLKRGSSKAVFKASVLVKGTAVFCTCSLQTVVCFSCCTALGSSGGHALTIKHVVYGQPGVI